MSNETEKTKAAEGAEKVKTNEEYKPVVVPLDKPIEAHGDTYNSLSFRKPTGADIMLVGGVPVRFNPFSEKPEVKFDFEYLPAMIGQLANIPPSSVAKMDSNDIMKCAWSIAGFFIPVWEDEKQKK